MSEEDRPIYVIDTNILIDYVDVIPGGEGKEPQEPTIDLSHAHLVIPTAVVRELDSFKREKYSRGKAARTVLKRLCGLFKGQISALEDFYNLEVSVQAPNSEQEISVLPVHKNFQRCLPFEPDSSDMDGQIILTAMAASMAKKELSIDGTEIKSTVMQLTFDNVVLLTNDNSLSARAGAHGIRAERYGYECPRPYTGRRDVVVPVELFNEFIDSFGQGIPALYFREQLPDEPELVDNEFIVMIPSDEAKVSPGYMISNDPDFKYIGRYYAEYNDDLKDVIMPLEHFKQAGLIVRNPGQAIYAEVLQDPSIAVVICDGPAGCGKTYMATIYGYSACKYGDYLGITVVPCENRRDKLGALPGDLDEKMDPDVQPIKNALRNYILSREGGPKSGRNGKDIDKAETNGTTPKGQTGKKSFKAHLRDRVDNIWANWFSCVPIETARGRDFAHEIAIYDEFQDQNAIQADTLIKRLGQNGKAILAGDINQIHNPYLDEENNGLVYASRLLFNNPMVAQVHFTENEIVRHPLVQEIAKRQKAEKPQSV